MKRVTDWLLLNVAPLLGAVLIQVLGLTVRAQTIGEDRPRACWQKGERIIFCSWHDQLLLMVCGYSGPGAKLLISASKDGEILARTMKYLGYGTVRGSSSRGGRGAFRQLVALAREDCDLGITPDGPKGPRHEMKLGAVQLARLSGRPVIPMAFVCSRGHRFSSWDRFLLPYPFSRGVYSFGEPLVFAEDEKPEEFRLRLQEAMESNERQAREHLESYGVSAV